MSSAPRITAKPAPGITPDQARNIRARAWAFVFECYARKKAEGRLPSPDGHDDTKGESGHDFRTAAPKYIR